MPIRWLGAHQAFSRGAKSRPPRLFGDFVPPLCAAGGSADAAGGAAAASDGCEVATIGVANTTTLVLRQGEMALNVSDLSANVLLSFPVALPASLATAAGDGICSLIARRGSSRRCVATSSLLKAVEMARPPTAGTP